jgi:hypothetical protein
MSPPISGIGHDRTAARTISARSSTKGHRRRAAQPTLVEPRAPAARRRRRAERPLPPEERPRVAPLRPRAGRRSRREGRQARVAAVIRLLPAARRRPPAARTPLAAAPDNPARRLAAAGWPVGPPGPDLRRSGCSPWPPRRFSGAGARARLREAFHAHKGLRSGVRPPRFAWPSRPHPISACTSRPRTPRTCRQPLRRRATRRGRPPCSSHTVAPGGSRRSGRPGARTCSRGSAWPPRMDRRRSRRIRALPDSHRPQTAHMARTRPSSLRRGGWQGRNRRRTAEARMQLRTTRHCRCHRMPSRRLSPARARPLALGGAMPSRTYRRTGKPSRRALRDVDMLRKRRGSSRSHLPTTSMRPRSGSQRDQGESCAPGMEVDRSDVHTCEEVLQIYPTL